jgi:hypothetical protein
MARIVFLPMEFCTLQIRRSTADHGLNQTDKRQLPASIAGKCLHGHRIMIGEEEVNRGQ